MLASLQRTRSRRRLALVAPGRGPRGGRRGVAHRYSWAPVGRPGSPRTLHADEHAGHRSTRQRRPVRRRQPVPRAPARACSSRRSETARHRPGRRTARRSPCWPAAHPGHRRRDRARPARLPCADLPRDRLVPDGRTVRGGPGRPAARAGPRRRELRGRHAGPLDGVARVRSVDLGTRLPDRLAFLVTVAGPPTRVPDRWAATGRGLQRVRSTYPDDASPNDPVGRSALLAAALVADVAEPRGPVRHPDDPGQALTRARTRSGRADLCTRRLDGQPAWSSARTLRVRGLRPQPGLVSRRHARWRVRPSTLDREERRLDGDGNTRPGPVPRPGSGPLSWQPLPVGP